MANPNQDARNSKGRYVRTLETAARDAQAAELYAQGLTYRQIAAELGYESHTSVVGACQRAVRDVVKSAGEQVLKVHIDRLEYLFAKAVEIAETDHVVVSHGRVVTDTDGQPLKDPGPTLAAIREARASLESFRKLTGLDQPTKVNLSGGVRYEVVGIDPEDLT